MSNAVMQVELKQFSASIFKSRPPKKVYHWSHHYKNHNWNSGAVPTNDKTCYVCIRIFI